MVKKIERDEVTFEKNFNNFGECYSFTLQSLTESAEEFAKENGADISTVTFEFVSIKDDYWGDESYLIFRCKRWETDEEFEDRKKKIEDRRLKARKKRAEEKKLKDKQDFSEYLRLKEKFEKGE